MDLWAEAQSLGAHEDTVVDAIETALRSLLDNGAALCDAGETDAATGELERGLDWIDTLGGSFAGSQLQSDFEDQLAGCGASETRLAYTHRGSTAGIYVANLDAGGTTFLTNQIQHPVWSPDGSEIAFVTRRDGNEEEVYSVAADGSGSTNLTNTADRDEQEPEWSPDGSRIVYAGRDDGNLDGYAMNADGSGLTRITINSVSDIEPVWIPLKPPAAHAAFVERYIVT